jgi:tRNA threonylcarbamoyl adenosine modification protein (Sua5/YciO/YrdC/YwlC family)
MIIEIHPDNPDERKMRQIVECLENGGLIIYPTDAVYSIGCDLNNSRAIERVAKLKGIAVEKANFSLVCEDLSHLSSFCKPLNNTVYKLMKRALPGPYTFILEANNSVPKIFKSRKKTIGIRVPDHLIPRHIVRLLGRPIISTSVHDDDEIIEYTTDPELIHERYKDKVDMVINAGFGNIEASTIIDCTGSEPEVIREGRGPIDGLL